MSQLILIEFFLIFAFLAFTSYMRITVILRALDKQLEKPPIRKQLNEKLRAYRDWCLENGKKPYLLTAFIIGVIGAIICWLPVPWLIFR